MAAKSAAIAKAGAVKPRRRTARRSVTPTLAILAALLLPATELPLAILLLAGLGDCIGAALIDRTHAKAFTGAGGVCNPPRLDPPGRELMARALQRRALS